MRQSRLMSLVEAIANVIVGYGIAVLVKPVPDPGFGLTGRRLPTAYNLAGSPS